MAPSSRRYANAVLASLVFACGSKEDGEDGMLDDAGATMPTAGDGASPDGGDPATPGDETHGVVKIELRRADNEAASPFPGTATVLITLDYLECLIAFYDAEPQWRMEGPSGFPAFDEWSDRLCSDNTGPTDAECTIVERNQELDVSKHLSLLYDVTAQADLENLTLYFGPLPGADLAMCEGGGAPLVRVGSNGAIRGLDASGGVVWEMKSFNPDIAATNQGQAIVVRAGLP